MNVTPETADALGFPFARRLLRSKTRTPVGAERAEAIAPFANAEEAENAFDRTDELRRWLDAEGELPLGGMPPIAEALDLLTPEGSVLSGLEILGLVRFCEVVAAIRDRREVLRGGYPLLEARVLALPDLQQILKAIGGKIAPSGELEDAASPELGRIRARIQSGAAAIRAKLEALLARSGADKTYSDAFVTERGGRFVLPVRSDAPTPVRGIVHGGSSSGATIFVEPLATVELNNTLVRLRDEEAAEIDRILRDWTGRLRARLGDLRSASDTIAAIDLEQARAVLAREIGAIRPVLEQGAGFAIAAGRHPLLEHTLAARGGRMVPVDVGLPPGASALIVSGPNAGGKTVVLKTAGLIALMAHAGLHVPAREARMPWLRQLLVDIGDRQSIEGSLSTFSAHIQNLATIVARLAPPALVLIDEIGTGTDPVEGGALAIALLERLRRAGALTIATTHHGPVKLYGVETPGVVSAAVEFDDATLAPTYRLLQGIAGASAGLAMAERLGLDPAIVEDARARIAAPDREAEGYLAKLRAMVASLEEDRRTLDELRKRLLDETRVAREEAIRSDNERAEQFRGELTEALEAFREGAKKHLRGITDKRETIRMEKDRAKRDAELRHEFERLRKAAGGASEAGWPGGGTEAAVPFEVVPGRRILVGPYGREGMVEAVEGDLVTVLVGSARFRVKKADCLPLEGEEGSGSAGRAGVSVVTETDARASQQEINLIGLRVDEGLEQLDKFLDEVSLGPLKEVRVIHGHGSGRLRNAVREFLSRHAQVVSHRPGVPAEGGNGATVVTLRE